ncbi:YeeE/YedE family protein [Kaistia geumhonensis]|uniref:Membrane protein YedE/YeeE n=1 Tax=Kaistia geumhonensis TaxID=410839 RepID=A0ABU0M173_9HYPH|nr:DUF6691 family protein [Kaistia geumhonensis]MCX5480067.1 YeeE/YedE family protein [Kaistia geumhonensis]MDQ0514705.1 putative membrane protein YedE/YeeE [Kaistia geumhonensis]
MTETAQRRPIVFHAAALVSGIIFGAGLAVSGMIHPQKVKAFLDVSRISSGGWDPSLAIVLAMAVIVTMGALRVAHRRRRPIAATSFSQPHARRVDGELVVGAAIFGVGWGLAGLCPGPALADLVSTFPSILLFLGAMLAGMMLVHVWRLRARRQSASIQEVET